MIQKKQKRRSLIMVFSLLLSFVFVLGACYFSSEGLLAFDLNISLGSGKNGEYPIDRDTGEIIHESGVRFILYNISGSYENEVGNMTNSGISNSAGKEDIQQEKYAIIRDRLDKLSDKELSEKFPEKYISEPTNSDGETTVKNLPGGLYFIKEMNTGSKVDVESAVVKLPIGNNYSKTSSIFPKASIGTPGNNPSSGSGGIKPGNNPSSGSGGNQPENKPPSGEGGTPNTGSGIGGKKFIKTNEGKKFKGLPNAKFIISRMEGGKLVNIKKNGKDMVLESDADGRFYVEGLPYGEYFLIETQAPIVDFVVYNLLKNPVAFKIDKNSDEERHTLRIVDKEIEKIPNEMRHSNNDITGREKKVIDEKNRAGRSIDIPRTGDIKIYIYSFLGMVVICIGSLIYKSGKLSDM